MCSSPILFLIFLRKSGGRSGCCTTLPTSSARGMIPSCWHGNARSRIGDSFLPSTRRQGLQFGLHGPVRGGRCITIGIPAFHCIAGPCPCSADCTMYQQRWSFQLLRLLHKKIEALYAFLARFSIAFPRKVAFDQVLPATCKFASIVSLHEFVTSSNCRL